MTLSLFPVSNSTLPFGCLIRKKATGTVIFSVAPLCRADLSMVSHPEENTYSRIPSGEAADAPAASQTQATTVARPTIVRRIDLIRSSLCSRQAGLHIDCCRSRGAPRYLVRQIAATRIRPSHLGEIRWNPANPDQRLTEHRPIDNFSGFYSRSRPGRDSPVEGARLFAIARPRKGER